MQLARSPKAVALLLAVLLATPLLAGCNANDSATGDASTSTAQEEAQGTSSDGSGDASEGAEEETVSFSYDTYLDENGHWKNVTALDYVTLPDDYASPSRPTRSFPPTTTSSTISTTSPPASPRPSRSPTARLRMATR